MILQKKIQVTIFLPAGNVKNTGANYNYDENKNQPNKNGP